MKRILCLFIIIMEIFSVSVYAKEQVYCFIGDSRAESLKKHVKTDKKIIWICKSGANFSYYWKNKKKIKNLDKDIIVFYQLGVNRRYPGKHFRALNDLSKLGFKKVYFLLAGPVETSKIKKYNYKVSNKEINRFNKAMLKKWKGDYIDSTGVIKNHLYTYDGLHYKERTSKVWFKHIFEEVEKDLEEEVSDKEEWEEFEMDEGKNEEEDEPIILEE